MHDLHLLRVGDEVAVREHGALRRARRTRCVDDRTGMLIVKGSRERRRGRQAGLLLARELDVVLRDARVIAELRERVDEVQRLVGEDVLDARVLDDERDLTRRKLEVDRHGERAEAHDAEIREDEIGAVAREDTDAVARADACRRKAVAAVLHGLGECFICTASFMIDDGEILWAASLSEILYEHK